jgi:hypothetical protein
MDTRETSEIRELTQAELEQVAGAGRRTDWTTGHVTDVSLPK